MIVLTPKISKSLCRQDGVTQTLKRVLLQLLKMQARSSSEWYLDSAYSKHMTGDKTYFNSLENYNARVKGKGSMVIPSCPTLDGLLYVDGLKASLLSISQLCDKDHRVNFCQDLCKVVNK
ncbi:hypothetical protein AAG906_037457 [Vitis piasezkii]